MRRTFGLVCASALAAVTAATAAAQERTFEDREIAVLGCLDKITARVSRLDVPVGRTVTFGSLTVTVRACREPPPIQQPESAAFLEIVDNRPGGPEELVFSGWMFGSSPALSALEHPVYDVWVIDCRNTETSSSSSPQ